MAIPRTGSGLSHLIASSSTRLSIRRSFTSSSSLAAFVNSNARSAAAPSSAATTATTAAPKPTINAAARPASATPSTTAAKPPVASTQQRTVTPSFPAKEPPVPTTRTNTLDSSTAAARKQRSLTEGLADHLPEQQGVPAIDWTRSYHGLGGGAFTTEQQEVLLAPIQQDDVEVKPDGLLYLPEIKYRRILNKAFGPGGWGLAPRGESIVTGKLVTREYGLIVQGRLISIARGEQQYFDPDGIPTATEGCKSNALMRCCKDLGIASELWDPRFIRQFTKDMTKEVWVEHVTTKKKKKVVLRKDDSVRYPFKETR